METMKDLRELDGCKGCCLIPWCDAVITGEHPRNPEDAKKLKYRALCLEFKETDTIDSVMGCMARFIQLERWEREKEKIEASRILNGVYEI